MNREFLKELGLEDETINSIMKAHGQTVQELKPAKEELEGLQSEKSNLENQLEELQGTLETKESELNSVDDIKKQLEDFKIKDLKTNIAVQTGIPIKLASRLSGTTEEEIKADAETFSEFVSKKQTLPMKPTEPNVNDKDAGLKKMLGNITKQGE